MINAADCEIVSCCSLLTDLHQQECQKFIDHGRAHHIKQGAYLFHQGEPASLFYILVKGQVKLAQVNPDGNQIILRHFGPGDGIGIIVALSAMDYPASATAIEDCFALCWDRQTTRELMLQYPQLALNGMELLANRFSWLQERYLEMATQRVEQRVALALLRLVRQFGKRVDEGVLIDMTLSRQDLAEMTGTNLYNVSRIISKWEQNGLVSTSRMRIILCQAHELVVIAEGIPR